MNGMAIRQRLDGMCVNTIVLTRPIRFAMRTATRYEAAVRMPVQKNSVPAAASDSEKVWYSHSASIDCTTKPPPNASRLKSAASVYTVFFDFFERRVCRPESVTSARGSPR